MTNSTKLSNKEIRKRADESLFFFAKAILGYDWLDPVVHGPICKALENDEIQDIKVIIPRGWLKSTLCSISYPMWKVAKNPQTRILLCQNSFNNACKKLEEIRGHFASNPMLRAIYPELFPAQWDRKDSFCVNRQLPVPEGSFEVAGTRTKVISRHYNEIIEDDLVAPDLDELNVSGIVPSLTDIEQAIGWHAAATALYVNYKTHKNVVVMTRWAERDMSSWIDENQPYYWHYQRASRETDGKADPNGEVVWPDRFDADTLDKIKASIGPYLFSALYMNNPIHAREMTFQPEWFKYFDQEPNGLLVYTTVDLAADPDAVKTSDPDYNVVLTTGKDQKTGLIYVLDCWRKRCNPGELIDQIILQAKRWHPLKIGLESIAYQSTVQYWLKERMQAEDCWHTVEPITHGRTAKEARIRGLQPVLAQGKLLFRREQEALVGELVAFPLGAHDDCADCLSMQQPFWRLTAKAPTPKPAPRSPFDHTIEEARRIIQGRSHRAGLQSRIRIMARTGVGK